MKKKSFVLLICLSFLLTGCSKQATMIPFDFSENTTNYSNQLDAVSETADLFSSGVCVIPVHTDTGSDENLSANSLLLVDETDDKSLYAKNIYERIYPASITKIVTALVTLKNSNLEDKVTFSKNAVSITEPGAKLCGFKEGDTVNLRDLLGAFLIYSGNDAGVAIAEHVGGSVEKFAEMMNQEAKNIGAVGSHFVNPHGLHDDNHYTTAYDIYLFFRQLISYSDFVKIIESPSVTVSYEGADGTSGKTTFNSTNRYLVGKEKAPEGITVIGGKTGTTSKAGSCLVLYSKDTRKHDFISVVIKADSGDSLFSQMTYLLKMVN